MTILPTGPPALPFSHSQKGKADGTSPWRPPAHAPQDPPGLLPGRSWLGLASSLASGDPKKIGKRLWNVGRKIARRLWWQLTRNPVSVRLLAAIASAAVGLAGIGTGVGMVAGLRSEVVELREQVNGKPKVLYVTPTPPPSPPHASRPYWESDDSGELEEIRSQIEDLEQERDQPAPPPQRPSTVRPEEYEPLQPVKPFDWDELQEERESREQEQRISRLEDCQRYGGISCY